ncbi:phospho-sugar mutase [Aeropyrum pernix K1]|uniref:Phospho-sugar mutase n=1 Tax=Aeropyrum pernix (strain ATCC 700893 / DSM 11879 / JCM 9820 / NBRC 100138 / K1) TaxID=272557 RepID=Q9Y952_AERPE|nr:phosphopentomutase/phosphoglucosamine mutase [Aeropyrum pernix]BAA81448.2 phospho-sugar mutase [Aeropyrum pernix K1]
MAGNVRLFGTAGIRGRYLRKVTPLLAYQVGLALAGYVGSGGSIVVAHDVRTTSPLLASMAASGVMAGGVDAILVGQVPLPAASYSVVRSGSKSGIMVTASHNPPWDNGIKIVDSRGMELTRSEEEELESIIEDGVEGFLADWNSVGILRIEKEMLNYYMEDIVARTAVDGETSLSMAVDCANGAASGVTPIVLRSIGVRRVYTFNCHPDGYFPGRHPEPRPDVLEPFIKSSSILGVQAFIAHDGDADRTALGVPGYGFVKQDLVIALLSWWKLRERKGSVVVSVDVGIEVEEVVEELGGRIVRSRLGKIHEKLLQEANAVLAAEPWKLIDPDWGLWVDGVYQAALLAHISLATGKTPRELLDMLPYYPSARVSYVLGGENERDRLYEDVVEKLSHSLTGNAVRILPIDGVRIDYEDRSWLLFRKSGTEPKLRVYAQAREKERLVELLSRIHSMVSGEASRTGIKLVSKEEHVSLPPGGARGFRGRSALL